MRSNKRQYYRNKKDNTIERIVHENIIDGVILTKFFSEDGKPIHNSEYKTFVNTTELYLYWEEFTYKPNIPNDKKYGRLVATIFKAIAFQLEDYGIGDGKFEEFCDIENRINMLPEIFFSDLHTDKKAYLYSVHKAVKQEYNEEVADDIMFCGQTDFYAMAYDSKTTIQNALNNIDG